MTFCNNTPGSENHHKFCCDVYTWFLFGSLSEQSKEICLPKINLLCAPRLPSFCRSLTDRCWDLVLFVWRNWKTNSQHINFFRPMNNSRGGLRLSVGKNNWDWRVNVMWRESYQVSWQTSRSARKMFLANISIVLKLKCRKTWWNSSSQISKNIETCSPSDCVATSSVIFQLPRFVLTSTCFGDEIQIIESKFRTQIFYRKKSFSLSSSPSSSDLLLEK